MDSNQDTKKMSWIRMYFLLGQKFIANIFAASKLQMISLERLANGRYLIVACDHTDEIHYFEGVGTTWFNQKTLNKVSPIVAGNLAIMYSANRRTAKPVAPPIDGEATKV